MDQDQLAPLDRAVVAVGSQIALASLCNVTPQAVSQWLQKGRPPADRVLMIEHASGVSRHELRPDIYGPPPPASPQQGAAA